MNHDRARVSLDAYDEQPRQEYVKCVVVGDTAVGKSRLICSYVFGQPGLSLTTLYQRPHIPTVFAIDQYVIDLAVRKRASTVVNGAPVQLRIWDTFGDHEKDRRFSFQNAHVVVVCFSIGSWSSLRNVNAKWYPEIKKYCPRAPIILVGTQLDRRHSDPTLFNHASQVTTLTDVLNSSFKGLWCKSNNNEFVRSIAPEIGRQTSREINASSYLETSIVTKHGVDQVFESAIRAALVYRRQTRAMLFSSYLKCVEEPGIQKPYLPEKLPEPEIHAFSPYKFYEFKTLLKEQGLSDVTFLVGHEMIPAHSVPLIASSNIMKLLLSIPELCNLLGYKEVPSLSCGNIKTMEGYVNGFSDFNLPQGYHSVEVTPNQFGVHNVCVQVLNVDPISFGLVLEYLYTGSISNIPDPIQLLDVASYLQEELLLCYLSNLINKEDFLNASIKSQFQGVQQKNCESLLEQPFYADVIFLVDGIMIPVHKQVLVSQCPMMDAMFKEGVFKESMLEQVDFRDTNLESFRSVLEYLYTGECKEMSDLHGTLQLANFLCLRHLVMICEDRIAKYITQMRQEENNDVYEYVIGSYILGEYHNAPQLSAWCLHFMSTNYNDLCRHQKKEMKNSLDEETLKHLEEHRWPPVWYLKEQDYYEKTVQRMLTEQNEKRERKKRKRICSGCF